MGLSISPVPIFDLDGLLQDVAQHGCFHPRDKCNRKTRVLAGVVSWRDFHGKPFGFIKYAHYIATQIHLEDAIRDKAETMAKVVARLSGSIRQIIASKAQGHGHPAETRTNASQGFKALDSANGWGKLIRASSAAIWAQNRPRRP